MSGPATKRILANATEHYLAGRRDQAEALCSDILRAQPDHVEALHLAALVALATGRTAQGSALLRRVLDIEFAETPAPTPDAVATQDEADGAVAAFRRGVALRPDDASLHVKLAAVLCKSGRYEQAEAACRRALARDPQAAVAHFNLAIALHRQGRLDEAAQAYRAVTALAPDAVDPVLNLGNVLMDQGRIDEAIAAYRQAVILKPDFAFGYRNLALALHRDKRLDEAMAACLQALLLEADHVAVHRIFGAILRDLGQLDSAEAAYRHAISLRPNDATLYCGLGSVFWHRQDLEQTVTACLQAIALAPDYADAHKLMGLALHDAGRTAEAVGAYRRALALRPDDPAICSNLGAALCSLGDFAAAIVACRQAIALDPNHAPAHTNLGVIFEEQQRLDDALAAHRCAIAANPFYAKGYANLAIVLRGLGRIDAATDAARKAIELDPDDSLARFNHALFLLMNGDYAHGFEEYEWRRRCKALPQDEPVFDSPEWQGEPLAGRVLLLHAERGYGDTLQFLRFVPAVVALGGRIVVQVQRPLAHLTKSLANVTVVSRGDPLPPFDLHLPLMSLPRLLGTTLATIPADVPYLGVEPAKHTAWRRRLADDSAVTVGVVWAGNPDHKADRHRSLAAAALLPQLVMPGVRLYSLQKEPRQADRPVLTALGDAIADLATDLHDFADTAAAVTALDLVIAVDTSVAHLAGALGRPTWMLLPHALDWRWLRRREDSPWYPTARLFRQDEAGKWEAPIGRVAAELSRVSGTRELLLPLCQSTMPHRTI